MLGCPELLENLNSFLCAIVRTLPKLARKESSHRQLGLVFNTDIQCFDPDPGSENFITDPDQDPTFDT